MSKDLLFEIGIEELPHGFIDPALAQLAEKAKKLLTQNRLTFDLAATYGTPRRLVIHITGLSERQDDLSLEHLGPAKKVAFDESGQPTKAAIGFAKGKGKSVEDLYLKQTEKGEYVAFLQKEEGRPTTQLLSGILAELVTTLSFPKTMRWGHKSIRFARPISWLLALFGESVIEFNVDGIIAENLTYGHRWLSPGPFVIHDPQKYFEVLHYANIHFDPLKRKEFIRQDLHATAAKMGATLVENDRLLDVVTNLVETPHAVVGSFKEEYLILPDRVIITSIEEHQKCFAMRNPDGGLLPNFIQISNSSSSNDATVKVGSERVIRARLADARFFFEEDKKTPLAAKTDKLKNVLFQKDLGTVYEKVARIQTLTAALADTLKLSEAEKQRCLRVALLAKADLVTGMIGEKEFTKLQGFMGWKYAVHDGEPATVAKGIYEHYMPRYAEDQTPETLEGALVALADKLDTVVGCFGVGIIPTGSQDPYALRRAALGITRIILERGLDFSISHLVGHALSALSAKLKRLQPDVQADVLDFMKQRLKNVLTEAKYAYDTIDAVLACSYDNFVDTRQRTQAIQDIRRHPDFDSIATANKRVTNILKKIGNLPAIDPAYFQQDEEKALYEALQSARQPVTDLIEQKRYSTALEQMVKLRQPIDHFFDKVFVMAEDAALRNNRLALLQAIKQLFDRIADFSLIVVSGEKE